MAKKEKKSITGAIIWMFIISLLLFWLPFVGPLVAGVIGGKKAGGVGAAILAVLLPCIIFGILLFLGFGVYIYSLHNQISDINEVCSRFPVGAPKGNLEEIEKQYSVQFMGVSRAREQPGTETAIFCAPLTMCDTSCRIEFTDNKVTKATVINL